MPRYIDQHFTDLLPDLRHPASTNSVTSLISYIDLFKWNTVAFTILWLLNDT